MAEISEYETPSTLMLWWKLRKSFLREVSSFAMVKELQLQNSGSWRATRPSKSGQIAGGCQFEQLKSGVLKAGKSETRNSKEPDMCVEVHEYGARTGRREN